MSKTDPHCETLKEKYSYAMLIEMFEGSLAKEEEKIKKAESHLEGLRNGSFWNWGKSGFRISREIKHWEASLEKHKDQAQKYKDLLHKLREKQSAS